MQPPELNLKLQNVQYLDIFAVIYFKATLSEHQKAPFVC